MAFSGNTLCTSFRKEIWKALHDFSVGGHVFKMAIYDEDATLNADTTVYAADNEISGSGYSAGGFTLTQTEPASGPSGIGFTNFANVAVGGSGLTGRGALIYNTSASNKAVMVLDFGSTRALSGQTITMPSADELNALLRF